MKFQIYTHSEKQSITPGRSAALVVVCFLWISITAAPLLAGYGYGYGFGFSYGHFHRHHYPYYYRHGYRGYYYRPGGGYYPSYPFFYGGFGSYYYPPVYDGPAYVYPGAGYRPAYRMSDREARRNTADADLAWLHLEVQPRDAAVYIDDQYAGKASEFAGGKKLLPVSPTSHTLRFEAPGYQSVQVDLRVNPLQTLDVTQQLRASSGAAAAPTPSSAPEVNAPPARLRESRWLDHSRLNPPGLRQPYSGRSSAPLPVREVEPTARTEAPKAAAEIQAKQAEGDSTHPPFGRIVVKFEKAVADAAVYVDGKLIGTTDAASPAFFVNDVPPGKHRVVVVKPGSIRFQSDVTVQPDETSDVICRGGPPTRKK